MPQQKLTVMISSTARDLPEHRKEAMDACLRQGMFPIMMEHLPATDAEAIPASLKMVDEADVYLLILAHRYGYVPNANNPGQISVTECEYNHAVKRKIPCLVFVMHADHPVKVADVEKGEGAVKLETFKNRVLTKVANFFKSPEDLRAHVINSLSKHREADLTTFHYVSDIPPPPEVFVAHPYTLLQTRTLIGRQAELKLLTDWITNKTMLGNSGESVSIMSVVAIGGMGKSALTWKFFNDIAPQEMKPLAGRMWWSFYESDATFENFVARALAYVTKRPLDELQKIPAPERESQLLGALNREPFLLVLDGLERILIAYARMDASRLEVMQAGKEKNLRKMVDPRVGRFLKTLAQVKNSRILLSSRLYPAELETDGGEPTPGTFRCDISGLTDEDAVELWRAFDVGGSRDELLSVFAGFGKHPLLIQALAGEIKRYHRAPGNFAEWRKADPQFDPSRFPKLHEAMDHVLEFALGGLDGKAKKVLHVIAAFRMPTGYDTLAGFFVGENKALTDERELDAALRELEDRGLMGWDKHSNRYDLHPFVRSVVWRTLGSKERSALYKSLHAHLKSLPELDNKQVSSLEDMTARIELFSTLIGLRRFDSAASYLAFDLHNRLNSLGANRQLTELSELLFPFGLDKLPRQTTYFYRSLIIRLRASAYLNIGLPGEAIGLFRRQLNSERPNYFLEAVKLAFVFGRYLSRLKNIPVTSESRPTKSSRGGFKSMWMLIARLYPSVGLSAALDASGESYEAQVAAYRALEICRGINGHSTEPVILDSLGMILAQRGRSDDADKCFARAQRIIKSGHAAYGEGPLNAHRSQRELWLRDNLKAEQFLDKAQELADIKNYVYDHIRVWRLKGLVSVEKGELHQASEYLHKALVRAREINYVQEELKVLIRLAELSRQQREFGAALEFLNDVWGAAERGPYRFIHADACNILAQIERDSGSPTAATEAAIKAYRLAWCDGPPFAYHWGLEKAKNHLKELGAPEPEMPPFDESKFEPMPEVEIDPDDEFHVGNASDS
jgi:tetratricopeptide (TPR) repeat protein